MKLYNLNMVFDNLDECEKWENEILTKNGRCMYNGEYIMCVLHEEAEDDKIILTEIWTC